MSSKRTCPHCNSAVSSLKIILPATLMWDARIDVNHGRFSRIADPRLDTGAVTYLDNRDQALESVALGKCPECHFESPLKDFALRSTCVVCGIYDLTPIKYCKMNEQNLCRRCYLLMLGHQQCKSCDYQADCAMKLEFGVENENRD